MVGATQNDLVTGLGPIGGPFRIAANADADAQERRQR